ncbi:hypothetical protein RCL1_008156 [Eukaryota sp. TZLM3-RCL]
MTTGSFSPALSSSVLFDESEGGFATKFLKELEESSPHRPSRKETDETAEDANAYTSKLLRDLPVPPSASKSPKPRSRAMSTDSKLDSSFLSSSFVSSRSSSDKKKPLSLSFEESSYKPPKLHLPSPSLKSTLQAPSSPVYGRTSDSDAPSGYFSAAFVENLQKQHKERIVESIASANRLLATKESEVKRLQEQLTKAQTDFQAKEESIKNEVTELRRLFDKQVEKVKADCEREQLNLYQQIEELKEQSRDQLLELRATFDEELAELKSEYERSLSSQKAAFQEERANWQRDRESIEGSHNEQLSELQLEHEAEVKRLEEQLSRESERLSAAREEFCNVSLQKGNEILELQTKIDEFNRNQELMEEKIKSILIRNKSEVAQRDAQWADSVSNLKRTLEKERVCNSQAISALQQRVRDFDSALKDAQAQHRTAITQATSEVTKLSDALTKAREAVEIHKSVAADSSAENVRLSQEIEVLRAELSAVEHEKRRAREQEGVLRHEVESYQSFIYGNKKR